MTSGLLRRWTSGSTVALDLGTAWARAQVCGEPLVDTQPSTTDFGPHVAPALHGGVVHNVAAAATLLQALFQRLPHRSWRGPRVLACVPSDACERERRALKAAVTAAGAADVSLLPETMAAAVGVGAELGSDFAQMLVDVGEGVTDAIVVDRRGMVASAAVRVGCAQLRQDVRAAIARQFRWIDEDEAERVLRVFGVRASSAPSIAPRIGMAKVDVAALRAALARSTDAIAACVSGLLRSLGDREACQVIESGIVVTGGGALLPGMRALIEDATQVATRIADDPLRAVIRGASAVLEEAARANRWPVTAALR